MKLSSAVSVSAIAATALAQSSASSWNVVSLVPSQYRTLLSLMPDFDWAALSSNPSYFIGVMTQMDVSDIPFTRKPGATKTVAEETVTVDATASQAEAEASGTASGAASGAASSSAEAASSSAAATSSNAANILSGLGLGAVALAGTILSLV